MMVQDQKLNQMGNNSFFGSLLVALIGVVFFSCGQSEKTTKGNPVNKEKAKIETVFTFNPDTSIKNSVILMSASIPLSQEVAKLPFYNDKKFLKTSAGQLLVLQGNYGGAAGTYQYFDVFFDKDTSFGITSTYSYMNLNDIEFYKSSSESFETESGIKLGLTKDEVLAIKGSTGYKETNQNDYTILSYVIDDFSTDILSRYNMPLYEMVLYFKDGILMRYSFGFPTP